MSILIKKGLKFNSKHFEGDCEIELVDEENNGLEVRITNTDAGDRLECWNLQHTVWGFEKGDYIKT